MTGRNNIGLFFLASLILFFSMTADASIFKTPVEKGFEAFHARDWQAAESWFLKSEPRFPALASFGLANCFANDSFPRFNLDSAYFLANKSLGLWSSCSKSELNIANQIGISISNLSAFADSVVSLAFKRAVREGSVEALDRFVFSFPVKAMVDSAISVRNLLAFTLTEKEGTASAYLSYMNKYPDSQFYQIAKNRHNRFLYDESVKGGSIGEYEVFIRSFPASPYITEAWRRVFSLFTKNSLDEKPYHDFIKKYPANPMADEAWYRIRENYISKHPGANIDSFLLVYPEFPKTLESDPVYDISSDFLFPFAENGIWGYMDTTGAVVIKPVYTMASTFHNGLAKVVVNTRFGFINFKGEEVVPPFYHSATNFHKGFSVVSENNLYGAIDRRGNTVVPMSYDSVHIAGDNLFIVFRDGKCNYLSRLGEAIDSSGFIACGQMESKFAICSKSNGTGVVRNDGHVVHGFNANNIKRLSETRFAIMGESGYAIADTSGRMLTKFAFEDVGVFSQGLAAASIEGRFGYVDPRGKTRIPFIFQVMEGFPDFAKFNEGLAVISLTGTMGIADTTGNVLIGDSFDQVRLLGGGLAVVYENGKGSLLQVNNETFLTAAEFDSTGFISYGSLPVKINGSWGAIDLQGKTLVAVQYNDIIPAPKGFHAIQSDTGYGVLDATGSEVVNAIYDRASIYQERFIKLEFAGKTEWFDTFTAQILKKQ